MLDASTIARVTDVLRPERTELVDLLRGLTPEQWARQTECPAYSVKGIASHILGDDLSLLSRQRDDGTNGLLLIAERLPGADFRTLLDAFNDQWVEAVRFLSVDLLLTLLELVGEWTAAYYEAVDPQAPGEPVGLFGANDGSSPLWQAIAREYLERWVHHSQIRRALDLGSLAHPRFPGPGIEVLGSAFHLDARSSSDEDRTWSLGEVVLGSADQAAGILTRGFTAEEIRALANGSPEGVELFALVAGRPG